MASQPVIVRADTLPRDGWDDPARGHLTWATLFGGGSPTDSMSAGVAELAPRTGVLKPHRHDPAEIYYILSGEGVLTLDGRESTVTAGTAVFIPGNAEHGIRNSGDAVLRFFYVFPTDRFSDVVYRFPE